MAQWNLYVDVVANALVTGLTNSGAAQLPPLVQGDTPNFRIYLLQPTGNPVIPYSYIPTAGIGGLQVALGDKVGNATNYYATQFAWNASVDPGDPNYWYASLALNTAAITTLLGANPTASTTFQIQYLTGGLPTTVLEIPATINASVIKGGSPVLPPGQTPLSAEQANATFLKRTISGAFILLNPNTGKQVAVYLGDDNAVHMDPIN